MKVKTCPKCGFSSLGERWSRGRMLEQYCHDPEEMGCHWVGEPYTPPKRRITNKDTLRIDEFHGWHYIIYDKYGHVQTDSATYGSKSEALKEMEDDLKPKRDYVDPAAPLTAVLFFVPSSVTIEGTMFKYKDGQMVEANERKAKRTAKSKTCS